MKHKHTIKNRRKQLRKYNLSADDYNLLYEKQNGVCAICEKPEIAKNNVSVTRLLSIDHDHKTGKVRGLLCVKCNIVLGHVNDDIGLLKKLIEYLRKF